MAENESKTPVPAAAPSKSDAAAHPKSMHAKPETPKPAVARRVASPLEEWVEKYFAQPQADSTPRKFAGTVEVTEYVPQIRLVAQRRRRARVGKLWTAVGLTLVGAGTLWVLAERWPFTGLEWLGALLAGGASLFGVARIVRPPLDRLVVDALINRIQRWDTRGRMEMINFVGCDYIELGERRGLRGFSYTVSVEPKLGDTVRLARSQPMERTAALLNTLELVRGLYSITRLPVRLRPARLAFGARLSLPEIAAAAPAPAPAKEDASG